MQQVIWDLRGQGVTNNNDEQNHIKRQAFWFMNSPSHEPYSFLWLCNILDVDPEYISRSFKDGSMMSWEPISIQNGRGGESYSMFKLKRGCR